MALQTVVIIPKVPAHAGSRVSSPVTLQKETEGINMKSEENSLTNSAIFGTMAVFPFSFTNKLFSPRKTIDESPTNEEFTLRRVTLQLQTRLK